jgi:threonine/homoserine/homoserine lactone efflux protein
MPSGPCAVLIVRNTLALGVAGGWASLAALVTAEVGYIALFLLGADSFLLGTPWLRLPIFTAGGLYLVYAGIRSVWRRTPRPEHSPAEADHHADSPRAAFGSSLVVAATNPGILLILAALVSGATSVFGDAVVRSNIFAFFVCVEAGVVAWFVLLIALAARLGKAIPHLMSRIDLGAGTLLAILGAAVLIREVLVPLLSL